MTTEERIAVAGHVLGHLAGAAWRRDEVTPWADLAVMAVAAADALDDELGNTQQGETHQGLLAGAGLEQGAEWLCAGCKAEIVLSPGGWCTPCWVAKCQREEAIARERQQEHVNTALGIACEDAGCNANPGAICKGLRPEQGVVHPSRLRRALGVPA